jgi:hypothetical protein
VRPRRRRRGRRHARPSLLHMKASCRLLQCMLWIQDLSHSEFSL